MPPKSTRNAAAPVTPHDLCRTRIPHVEVPPAQGQQHKDDYIPPKAVKEISRIKDELVAPLQQPGSHLFGSHFFLLLSFVNRLVNGSRQTSRPQSVSPQKGVRIRENPTSEASASYDEEEEADLPYPEHFYTSPKEQENDDEDEEDTEERVGGGFI
ncbi:hypothetical protein BDW66DRAFT_155478 [Aspergillus desertorum]